MKNKTLTIILGMVLLIGIITAAPILSNLEGINVPLNVVAGNTFQGNFSFDYLDIPNNEDNSPLIIKLDLTSDDQTNYPVWKDDFEISGYVDKCTWTILGLCILPSTVLFDCSEIAPLTIDHAIGSEIINNIPDGTFYCYNEEADLKLNEHDKVFLDVTSHPALYPGTYDLTASFYYLNDTYNPIVIITNKADFENVYYKSGNNIEVKANINDLYLYETFGKIYWNGNETFLNEEIKEGIYYYSKTLPDEIPEGDYSIKISAKDKSGNIGMDETVLLIDETAPVITLIQPDGSIYDETIPIELNVTDAKSGVDEGSVKIRLREIKNAQICPETGGSIGNYSCITTGWISLGYNESSKTFKKEVNTTELNLTSGEYWLDAKANDILGNEAMWIQED